MDNKYFTKSAFKVALDCPTRLYYCCDDRYANQDVDNDFLQALAKGGYQVGELAKVYYQIPDEADIKSLDYDDALKQTQELFKKENVNIAEAAFKFGKLFVRADIIVKNGHHIDLIEVKAKSWEESTPFINTKNAVKSDILHYVYDVAFQKYVIEKALKELYPKESYIVHAYLMMADKGKVAQVGGINQMFKIKDINKKKFEVERSKDVEKLIDIDCVLHPFDVEDVCHKIIKNEINHPESFQGKTFESFIDEMSEAYCSKNRLSTPLILKYCSKCPFYVKDKEDKDKGKLDGRKECWTQLAPLSEAEYDEPLILDLWGGGYTGLNGILLERNHYKLSTIDMDTMMSCVKKEPSNDKPLNYMERRLLQIGMATNEASKLSDFTDKLIQPDIFLDKNGLKAEMDNWNFEKEPLHFIDFETSATALPFYKGMHPYEQVAFQFSHHVVEKNEDGTYSIRHAGQYINTEKGFFPNFEFLRELKKQLEGDKGTVFRYATHENTILRHIKQQLLESNEVDKDKLIAFIDTLTEYKTGNGNEKVYGDRNMVDMKVLVENFFYAKSMKGSNSIKAVLPAVLNASQFLREKYSQPIYGSVIHSENISPDNPLAWISIKDGVVENPYKKLPPVSNYLGMTEEEMSYLASKSSDDSDEDDMTIAEGGAALTAYSMLQFSDFRYSEALKQALLRYCELDTMAMVFLWEYFNHECYS